jgi:hypothetical protein
LFVCVCVSFFPFKRDASLLHNWLLREKSLGRKLQKLALRKTIVYLSPSAKQKIWSCLKECRWAPHIRTATTKLLHQKYILHLGLKRDSFLDKNTYHNPAITQGSDASRACKWHPWRWQTYNLPKRVGCTRILTDGAWFFMVFYEF